MRELRKSYKVGKALMAVALSMSLILTACANTGSNANSSNVESLSEAISYDDYKLEQVIVLSRHNIRSPLSGAGSALGSMTPHEWFEWTSGPSELSVRGGVLETEMGEYFRKWLESEELISENYHPTDKEVRIYANSKQRTIATAQYFKSGLIPTANMDVEYHAEFDTMDPVFNPQLTFSSADYAADAEAQIRLMFDDSVAALSDNYDLLAKTLDFEKSEAYKSGEVADFDVTDSTFKFEEGAEPAVSGSLKTACSASDALILQYYEESDKKKAAFGHVLTLQQWENIAEIKDVYGDVLFTTPLIAVNVANPLLEEIKSEMNSDGRKFTFLCGHDSNIGSVLAALGVSDYKLPDSIEKKTPIGSKLVLSKWKNSNNEEFWSADLLYQTTEQLRNLTLLGLNDPPAIYHLNFEEIVQNSDGLYGDKDFRALIDEKIKEYDDLYNEYVSKAA